MRPPPLEGGFARCHPLVTFAYFAALVVASVFSLHPLLLGLTFCSALLYALLQRGAAALRLALLFLLPAVVLTALINPLFNHRGATVLFYLADNPMTAEAFLYGLATGVLMGGILLWFSCMGPLFRSDKVVYLFGRVSPALSLTLSICLRFVPLLKARFGEVSMGQRCLGRGGQGGPLSRLRVFGRELSILLSWSLEAAIATSDSMEARGYGLKGRTSFHTFRFTRQDGALLGLIGGLFAAACTGIFSGVWEVAFYPKVVLPPASPLFVCSAAAYGALLLLPPLIDWKGERQWKRSAVSD